MLKENKKEQIKYISKVLHKLRHRQRYLTGVCVLPSSRSQGDVRRCVQPMEEVDRRAVASHWLMETHSPACSHLSISTEPGNFTALSPLWGWCERPSVASHSARLALLLIFSIHSFIIHCLFPHLSAVTQLEYSVYSL